jgi:hypothetical protein
MNNKIIIKKKGEAAGYTHTHTYDPLYAQEILRVSISPVNSKCHHKETVVRVCLTPYTVILPR